LQRETLSRKKKEKATSARRNRKEKRTSRAAPSRKEGEEVPLAHRRAIKKETGQSKWTYDGLHEGGGDSTRKKFQRNSGLRYKKGRGGRKMIPP